MVSRRFDPGLVQRSVPLVPTVRVVVTELVSAAGCRLLLRQLSGLSMSLGADRCPSFASGARGRGVAQSQSHKSHTFNDKSRIAERPLAYKLRRTKRILSEGGGTRTHDLGIKSPLLYQLSYAPSDRPEYRA